MKIRRDVASIPVRSAKETWRAIRELISGPDSVEVSHLEGAASVMESLIADECPSKVPIVVKGSGARLVIYCLYGEDAMEAGEKVEKLSWNPTGGDWRLTAPCEGDDVKWMNQTLKSRAPRVLVHDVDVPPTDEESEGNTGSKSALEVDWGVLDKS